MDQRLEESLNLGDESMVTDYETDGNVVSHVDFHGKIEDLHSTIELQHIQDEELLIEDENVEMIDELPGMTDSDLPMLAGEEVLAESHSPDEDNVKLEMLSRTDNLIPDLETPLEVPPLIPVTPRSTQSTAAVNSLISTQGSRLSTAVKPLAIAPKPVTLITKSVSLPNKKTFTALHSQRDGTIVGLDSSGRQVLFQMANVAQNRSNGAPATAIINSGSNGSPKLKLVTQASQQFFVLADGNTSKLPFHAKTSFITKKPATFTTSNATAPNHFTTTKKIVPASGIAQVNIPKGTVQAVNSSGNVATPKYLTLQQAQQLGLLGSSPNLKVQQVLNVANKPAQNVQMIKPQKAQASAKSPTKILPAPVQGGKLILPTGNQTVVIRPSTPKTTQVLKSSMGNIKLATSQGVNFAGSAAAVISGNSLSTRPLQSIHVPGKFVRLIPANATAAMTKFKPSPIAPKPLADSSVALATCLASNTTGQRTLLSVAGGKTLLLPDGLSGFIQMPSSKGQNTLIATSQTPIIKKIVTKPQQKLIPVTLSFASSLQKITTTTSLLNTTTLTMAPSATTALKTESQEAIVTSEIIKTGVPSPDSAAGSELEDSKAIPRSLIDSVEKGNDNDEAMAHEEETYMDDSHAEEAGSADDAAERADSDNADKDASRANSSARHVIMLPASFLQQINNGQDKNSSGSGDIEIKEELLSRLDYPPGSKLPISTLDNSLDLGMRPRKPCNCTKSQCLKLYCDCFANGEFCHQCNCNNCFNNLDNEEERQKAIKSCLERNPNAFRPKIGKARSMLGQEAVIRRHNKGCNCKRSGCLKNYCECYEAKIACSANCKCVGCRNVEESVERSRVSSANSSSMMRRPSLAPGAMVSDDDVDVLKMGAVSRSRIDTLNTSFIATASAPPLHTKQPCSFMTSDVIDAVCQCLLAAAGEGSADGETVPSSPVSADPVRRVLEEYARCLQDIIGAARHAQSPGEAAA